MSSNFRFSTRSNLSVVVVAQLRLRGCGRLPRRSSMMYTTYIFSCVAVLFFIEARRDARAGALRISSVGMDTCRNSASSIPTPRIFGLPSSAWALRWLKERSRVVSRSASVTVS